MVASSSTGRRSLLQTAGASALSGAGLRLARAATGIPAEIRIIVPYSAGGGTDLLARLLADRLGERNLLKAGLDYKPGAGSMIGVAHVARSTPDGSTLGIVNGSFLTNALLHRQVPYRIGDLRPVTQLVDYPLAVAVSAKAPWETVDELIDEFRRNERDIDFAMPGMGGPAQLAGEMISRAAGIRMIPVGYKGSPPAHTDLIGGRVPVLIDVLMALLPQVRANRMKILALLTKERIRGMERYPAIAETLPGVEAQTFMGLIAPAATPDAVVGPVAARIAQALTSREDEKYLEDMGMFPAVHGPAAFARLLEKETAKWSTFIREQNIPLL